VRRDGHPALHVPVLRQAVLGRSEILARALYPHARRQGEDANAADDGRARHANSDATIRGVLCCPEDARRSRHAPALRSRVPWYVVEAVQLDAHAAVHDELVQPVAGEGRDGGPAHALIRTATII